MTFTEQDRRDLERAYAHLEHPSMAARLTSIIGTPLETGFKLLPKPWYRRLHEAAENAIGKALDTAISTFQLEADRRGGERFHKLLGISSGALGGFFGVPALLVELPITTTIMLRSIADIARSEGEDLQALDTRLACLEVFALGGRSEEDDAAETGYYGIRLALALPVSQASEYIVEKGLASEGGPILVDFVAKVSSRFGISLSEKVAAQIMPLAGAAGGALINAIFIQHFQDMARSHFTVRRLERKYGPELVKAEYERLSQG